MPCTLQIGLDCCIIILSYLHSFWCWYTNFITSETYSSPFCFSLSYSLSSCCVLSSWMYLHLCIILLASSLRACWFALYASWISSILGSSCFVSNFLGFNHLSWLIFWFWNIPWVFPSKLISFIYCVLICLDADHYSWSFLTFQFTWIAYYTLTEWYTNDIQSW